MANDLFAPNARLDACDRNNLRIFRSSIPLPDNRPDILERLRHWATVAPARVLLSEPFVPDRRAITYGEALQFSRALSAVLADRCKLRAGNVIATLAPASIDALLLKLACLHGGFVHVALPPFLFREGILTSDNRHFLATSQPKAVLAPAGHPAVEGLDAQNLSQLVAAARAIDSSSKPGRVYASSDFAEIFFTSGSIGERKAVPITRGMISSNQVAIAALWPFLAQQPLVLVDWLPWHHVFGGLDNIFKVIWNGGAMHVDLPPSEATMAATLQLLATVKPTMHIAVPLGIQLLLDALKSNATVSRSFTSCLRAIFFAGAGIDPSLWHRLRQFRDTCGSFEILSGYGATEAASTICLSPAPIERPGELGHPLPGHDVVLTETDDRLELRVRGPNVAPGYLTNVGLIPLPVDEHGFYRTGDAALLQKREDAQVVFAFDGRLAEDFKLASGIKVRAHWLRARLIAHCAPLADDIILAGENRKALVALIFVAAPHQGDYALLEKLKTALAAWNGSNPSNSTVIARFAVASIAPDRARGEISDKGQIVRSRFLRNHADLFDDLYEGKGLTPDVSTAS